jgi:hypothetical protein
MKDVFVNIRMTQELKEQLEAIAEKEERSLSKQILVYIKSGISKKERKPKAEINQSDFNEFWQAYPKKISKPLALTAYAKVMQHHEKIIEALKWQRVCEQWTKDGGQFIPNPATYLNQQKWLDEQPLPTPVYETPYQKSMRKRVEEISPNIARKVGTTYNPNFVDEVKDAITDQSN